MHYLNLVSAVFLSIILTSAFAETIAIDQLPQVNSFAIVDTEGEQYIAATNGGLFHSDDHGHNWNGYPGFDLPRNAGYGHTPGYSLCLRGNQGLAATQSQNWSMARGQQRIWKSNPAATVDYELDTIQAGGDEPVWKVYRFK